MKSKPSSEIICYIPNRDINMKKWNACLQTSDNPLLYASSSYLNGMCKHWDALVMNDYEAIMPLPWNRKWGIAYIYSPYFILSGGVFGIALTKDIVLQFIKVIPKKFLYVDTDLNEQNFFPFMIRQNEILCKERRNTFLDLNPSYDTLYSQYSSLAKRKIRKAKDSGFRLNTTPAVAEVISLYCRHYRGKDEVVEKFDFTNLIGLLENQFAQQTKTYILSFPGGDACAFYLLLYDENYVYWLLGGSTERGKEAGAFYYLKDKVIRDFANSNRTFRFEGSDHDGIHFFNRQFGGQTVVYPRIVLNRLPWPFSIVK